LRVVPSKHPAQPQLRVRQVAAADGELEGDAADGGGELEAAGEHGCQGGRRGVLVIEAGAPAVAVDEAQDGTAAAVDRDVAGDVAAEKERRGDGEDRLAVARAQVDVRLEAQIAGDAAEVQLGADVELIRARRGAGAQPPAVESEALLGVGDERNPDGEREQKQACSGGSRHPVLLRERPTPEAAGLPSRPAIVVPRYAACSRLPAAKGDAMRRRTTIGLTAVALAAAALRLTAAAAAPPPSTKAPTPVRLAVAPDIEKRVGENCATRFSMSGATASLTGVGAFVA